MLKSDIGHDLKRKNGERLESLPVSCILRNHRALTLARRCEPLDPSFTQLLENRFRAATQTPKRNLIRIAENSRAQCEPPTLVAGLSFLARRWRVRFTSERRYFLRSVA